VWRPVFCINNSSQTPAALPTDGTYPACRMFQVAPNWIRGCDSSRPQSPHPGGIMVAMADGSVRLVAGTIADTIWAAACDPQDGNPLSNF